MAGNTGKDRDTHIHNCVFMCVDKLRKIIINYASRRPFKVHLRENYRNGTGEREEERAVE